MTPLLGALGGARSAWWLVEDLRAIGYDPEVDGDTELWLYDRIGTVVADYQRSVDEAELA